MKGTGKGGGGCTPKLREKQGQREEMRTSAILRDGEHKKRRQREREQSSSASSLPLSLVASFVDN